ncbi:MAG TPA: NAD(P)-dependent oxidoreductase, partial [Microlunatus sp.]|nr:NAD(P)-dependent oxidoreductase [Microlunatus sp.]
MSNRRRVLVTGAAGYIAGQLLPALRERYDLTLVDVTRTHRDGHEVDGVELLDLLDDPTDRFAALCSDVDTVVHCGMRPPSGTPTYAAERVNLDMTARVYEVAAAGNVRRVVCTSTNQAAKWYERSWKAGRRDRVGPEDYPRPDSFYGWAKAAYETLGFLYATGEVSRPLEVVQIRIVAPRPIRAETFA